NALGKSFALCTAKSIRFFKSACSIAPVNKPLRPAFPSSIDVLASSPCVLMILISNFKSAHLACNASTTNPVCLSASSLPRVPTTISIRRERFMHGNLAGSPTDSASARRLQGKLSASRSRFRRPQGAFADGHRLWRLRRTIQSLRDQFIKFGHVFRNDLFGCGNLCPASGQRLFGDRLQ